ncbi:hypothetical protein M885DRAFT_502156 [Pelagophyceae sp. CCMP2097]|nr:hypothetical protein M885DRAFT_502156 [Pelagophyceae sp. CCMP2097]
MLFHDICKMHVDGDGLFQKILEATAKTVAKLRAKDACVMDVGAAAAGLSVELSREEASEFFGLDLSEREWRAARWWSMGPGVGASMKVVSCRRGFRVDKKVLLGALEYLTDATALQQLAYGTKEVRLRSGEKVTVPEALLVRRKDALYTSYAAATPKDARLCRAEFFRIAKGVSTGHISADTAVDPVAEKAAKAFKIFSIYHTICIYGEHSTRSPLNKKQNLLKFSLEFRTRRKHMRLRRRSRSCTMHRPRRPCPPSRAAA